MVLARPDERETCPYHFSLRLFTMVRRSLCCLITCLILARTSSMVTWFCRSCVVSWGSTSFPWLVVFFGALLWESMIHKLTGRWMWQGSASIVSRNREKCLWFQPCQYCCCLCYPGEYLRLGTLISYNSPRVLEVCDNLKLLSIYLDLCVDATGVVCHQLGPLSTDLHAVRCGGFVETVNKCCQFFFLSC